MMRHLLWACGLLALLTLAAWAQEAKEPAAKPAPPKVVTLEGTLKDLTNLGPEDPTKMVTAILVMAEGERKVQLAPQAFLTELGVTLKDGAAVKLTGLLSEKSFTVQDIALDGKSYKLRDARGRALWNQYVGLPDVTITGKIVKVIIPEPKPAKPAEGDAANKPAAPRPDMRPVAVQITTDAGLMLVAVGPKAALDTLGFTLAEGQTITLAGWKRDAPAPRKGASAEVLAKTPKATLYPRTLAIGDKTYTLRDDKGKDAWMPKPADKNAKPAAKK